MRSHIQRCCFKYKHAPTRAKMLFQIQTCAPTCKDAVSNTNMRLHEQRCCFKYKHAPPGDCRSKGGARTSLRGDCSSKGGAHPTIKPWIQSALCKNSS